MEATQNIPALSVRSLNKFYGSHQVLHELSLEVAPGAIMGLVGLNGSGKTTTIECLLGLQGFQSGSIRVMGHAPDRLHESEGQVVAVFDSPSLHPHLTVRQALIHACQLLPEQVRSPAEVEELLGIARYRDFRIRQLSLGNKRRASIAQALLGAPRLVVLDEPFNGLDAGGVDDLLALIRHLNTREHISFMLSSHQLPYLEQICSHIAILHDGRIARSGTIDELLQGSQSTLRIVSDDTDSATAQLQAMAGVEIESVNDNRVLVSLSGADSASINRNLVKQGIDVSELVVEKASLSSLFRHITGESQP